MKNKICIHKYIYKGFTETSDNYTRYSIRHYKCEKCGKEILIDGRLIDKVEILNPLQAFKRGVKRKRG